MCFPTTWGKWKSQGKQKRHTDCVTPACTARTVTGCLPWFGTEHLGSRGTFSGLFKGAGIVQSCLRDNWNIPSAQEVQLQMIDGRVVPGDFFFPFQTVSVTVSCLGALLIISFPMKCWKEMKLPFLTIIWRLISKYLFRANLFAFLHDEKLKQVLL